MTPFFSVIIPTCNRLDELAACLERLAPDVQCVNELGYELIVTDDGRKSPAQKLVIDRFPWARWTAGPAKGPAANRNHGASLSSGQWLVFIDDDCLPEPQLLRAYQQPALSEISASTVVLEGPTLRIGVPPSLLWVAPHNPNGGACISANFAIRKNDFETSGGFDERYPSAAIEDTEFFSRLQLSGGVTRFVADAIVHHPLRKRGAAQSLANKWEGKVIFSMDQGASASTVMWRLPWHVFRVVQSRFRGRPCTYENLFAASIFLQEWLLVVWKTPGWVMKWSRRPKSVFWKCHIKENGPVRRYGF
jgi:GT2 family glycosyltransferase